MGVGGGADGRSWVGRAGVAEVGVVAVELAESSSQESGVAEGGARRAEGLVGLRVSVEREGSTSGGSC